MPKFICIVYKDAVNKRHPLFIWCFTIEKRKSRKTNTHISEITKHKNVKKKEHFKWKQLYCKLAISISPEQSAKATLSCLLMFLELT